MNSVIITGRITGNAEFIQGDVPAKNRAIMNIAVNTYGDKAEYFKCIAWGTKADFVKRGVEIGLYQKGNRVEICGQLHMSQFKDKEGKTKSDFYIGVTECSCERYNGNAPQANAQTNTQPAPTAYTGNPAYDNRAFGMNAGMNTQPAYNPPAYQQAMQQMPRQGMPQPAMQQPQNFTPQPQMPQGNYGQYQQMSFDGFQQSESAFQGNPFETQQNNPAPSQGGFIPATQKI